MPPKFPVKQAQETTPRPPIALALVKSDQIGAVGYDPATSTLAVQFKPRMPTGTMMPVYLYPEVTAEQHAAFVGAESLGKHHSAHFKSRPFKSYPAEPMPEA